MSEAAVAAVEQIDPVHALTPEEMEAEYTALSIQRNKLEGQIHAMRLQEDGLLEELRKVQSKADRIANAYKKATGEKIVSAFKKTKERLDAEMAKLVELVLSPHIDPKELAGGIEAVREAAVKHRKLETLAQ
jgi:predicted  nucleic acid-binding Zn-ribbon protein